MKIDILIIQSKHGVDVYPYVSSGGSTSDVINHFGIDHTVDGSGDVQLDNGGVFDSWAEIDTRDLPHI